MSRLRVCTFGGCSETLDWEGPPNVCVEHFDIMLDGGARPTLDDPVAKKTRPSFASGYHAEDVAVAALIQRHCPEVTVMESLALASYARTGQQVQGAHELGISVQTMKNHLGAVYRKMEVGGAVQALYRVFGIQAQAHRQRADLRTQLEALLRAEWLDEALKLAAHSAVDAMIRTVDRRVYQASPDEPMLPGYPMVNQLVFGFGGQKGAREQ